MKTQSFPTMLLRKGLVLASLVGLSLPAITTVEAAITADFSGDNSSSVVDAWQGMPGDGWKTAWNFSNNSPVTLHNTVTDADPFPNGSGRYLSASVTNGDAARPRGMVLGRQYDSSVISYSESHTVSFEFRLDTPLEDIHRINFFDTNTLNLTSEGAGTTWLIRIDSDGSIRLYDGKNKPAIPVSFTAGEVYRFTINITPSAVPEDSTYTVRIDNLTQPSTYQSGALHFFTPSSSVGGYLNFYSSVVAEADKTTTYSLDNISVIPEASTVALGGAGLLILLATRRVYGR